MSHWARTYIGRRWSADDRPGAYSCWGLVREVFRTHYGIEFPLVAVSDSLGDANLDNVAAIKEAARVSGMRRVTDAHQRPADGDIVLMRSLTRLHCGVVLRVNQRTEVLHSAHETGVVCQPWADAIAGMTPELWRRA